jgi:hypothetical protein
VRIVAIALVTLAALGGCSRDDTILRITVEPGTEPPPVSMQVMILGIDALGTPTRNIAHVTFPGTIVVHGLPTVVTDACVQAFGFNETGVAIVGGSANVEIVPHRTTLADIQMSNAFALCDGATPIDGGDSRDLPFPIDGGAPPDMLNPICPINAIFCDDFETGNLSKWTGSAARLDAGTVAVQSAEKAHGSYALKALANGNGTGMQIYAQAEKDFPPTAPPFALRANVFFPTTLDHYNQVLALYENATGSINSFSIGGDNDNGIWEVSENESNGAPDRLSDMVPTEAGKWHCVELTIGAGGMVDFYVDNHHLIGPWQRASNVSYSMLLIGVTRSVTADYVAYIDDVAIGPSRLYCPP